MLTITFAVGLTNFWPIEWGFIALAFRRGTLYEASVAFAIPPGTKKCNVFSLVCFFSLLHFLSKNSIGLPMYSLCLVSKWCPNSAGFIVPLANNSYQKTLVWDPPHPRSKKTRTECSQAVVFSLNLCSDFLKGGGFDTTSFTTLRQALYWRRWHLTILSCWGLIHQVFALFQMSQNFSFLFIVLVLSHWSIFNYTVHLFPQSGSPWCKTVRCCKVVRFTA